MIELLLDAEITNHIDLSHLTYLPIPPIIENILLQLTTINYWMINLMLTGFQLLFKETINE